MSELISEELKIQFANNDLVNIYHLDIIMSILSNYSPDCTVKCWIECEIDALENQSEVLSAFEYAQKFKLAVDIADINVNRTVTHNKGIFNGLDAVVLATGNDWRAVEANAHAWSVNCGRYKSLSSVYLNEDKFRLEVEIPLQIGTIGGVTSLHPLAKFSLDLLGNPNAEELMMIMAAAGLANNFAAVNSLITTGIQKGHMKLHIHNILKRLNASEKETELSILYFTDKKVSVSVVESFKTIKAKCLKSINHMENCF